MSQSYSFEHTDDGAVVYHFDNVRFPVRSTWQGQVYRFLSETIAANNLLVTLTYAADQLRLDIRVENRRQFSIYTLGDQLQSCVESTLKVLRRTFRRGDELIYLPLTAGDDIQHAHARLVLAAQDTLPQNEYMLVRFLHWHGAWRKWSAGGSCLVPVHRLIRSSGSYLDGVNIEDLLAGS